VVVVTLSLRWSGDLHDAIMSPGPAATEIKFLFPARRGIRVMKIGRREDHAEFPEQILEQGVPVCKSRELDAISVDVQDCGFFSRNDEFSQISQRCCFAAKELDHFMSVFKRTAIANHQQEL